MIIITYVIYFLLCWLIVVESGIKFFESVIQIGLTAKNCFVDAIVEPG
jgi:hypothetical protein